ncbi:methyltransferase [Luteolibacter arcticus]|uniref:Methyltransferase n=1 Tax=Luteolibacter arcticus TaxID=1581411 RepID=A0ABT3GE25_9BACT|nr:methyltransferase [Luteolibacter arcticus]MCW1921862.1 methyltransferase [Luteolibacter arcticus]
MASLFRDLESWDPAPLRAQLSKGGFHRTALQALGMPEHWLRSSVRRAAMLGRAQAGSPIHTLIRLFTLGDDVEPEAVLFALGDAAPGLLEIGFLEASGGRVRSHYQICPIGDRWVGCDFHQRQGEDVDDYVMGVGPSSILLASLAPQVKGRVLELACGIGWLAGALSSRGMEVVATDLNARALELGRFSARLGGFDGIDFRQGDGLSTVAGETFDLIVANPPYVQSPGGSMTYKEAPTGDPVCARLLREIPNHLAPGGIAVVLINWTHTGEDDWSEVPLSWVPAAGVRRWLFQSDCSSPADYAWKWIAPDLRFQEEQVAEEEIRRWLRHYQNTGVRRISGGFMVLQKCASGEEWVRTESRAAENIEADAGHDVLRVLANESWLTREPDLLHSHFRVPPGIAAEARMTLHTGSWARDTIRLTSPARLSYDGQIDENILRLLALLGDGGTPADMVAEIRSRLEFAALPDLPERIAALVRDLVSHGMLVPVAQG